MKPLLPKTTNRRKCRETVFKIVLEIGVGDPCWWVSIHRGRVGRPAKVPTFTLNRDAAREFALLYTRKLLLSTQSPEPRAQSR